MLTNSYCGTCSQLTLAQPCLPKNPMHFTLSRCSSAHGFYRHSTVRRALYSGSKAEACCVTRSSACSISVVDGAIPSHTAPGKVHGILCCVGRVTRRLHRGHEAPSSLPLRVPLLLCTVLTVPYLPRHIIVHVHFAFPRSCSPDDINLFNSCQFLPASRSVPRFFTCLVSYNFLGTTRAQRLPTCPTPFTHSQFSITVLCSSPPRLALPQPALFILDKQHPRHKLEEPFALSCTAQFTIYTTRH